MWLTRSTTTATATPQFATVCARDRAQAVAGCRRWPPAEPADGVVGPHEGPCGPGTVFVYSGQGSHWAGMGRQLLVDEPVFAEAIAELEPIFVEQVGFSLQQVIADGEPVSGDAQVQPVLMGLQLALTELWRSYGVHPDAVIGHSMGEVTAAVVAGALTVADGLRVIATRSRLMSQLAGQGAVALLKLDAEATAALIADYPEVSVAGYISPRQTVIAGPVAPVDAVIAAVSAQNRFARRVNMEVASHTALMDPILPELRTALADLTPEIAHHSVLSPPSSRAPRAPTAGCRVLGGQRAPAGAAESGHHGSRRRPRHLHRDQRSSDPDARRQRHAGVGDPSPQRGDAVARR